MRILQRTNKNLYFLITTELMQWQNMFCFKVNCQMLIMLWTTVIMPIDK